MYHFGEGSTAVWRWRAAFIEGTGKFRTPGSRAAHLKASQAGAEALKLNGFSDAVCDARVGRRKGCKMPPRWTPENGAWMEKEPKLLRGRLTDAEVGARIGRTENAVRAKRRRMNLSTSGRSSTITP
jgi:hypothetical protein